MEEISADTSRPPLLLSFAAPEPEQVSDDGPNGPGILAVDLQRVIDDCLGFLVTGSSGSGKSHLVRGILEQTHGRVQQIVVDTEGEYVTLRERFDYLVAAKGGGDIPLSPQTAAILCRRVMELNISVILDIYELEPRERQAYVAVFLRQLIETPLEHRRPVFVAIPEVHLYAPQGPSTDAKEAVRDLVARGRKRGIMPIFDTQSVAKTDKTALEAIRNKLVGYIELDVHLDRAAAELGLRGEDREQLRRLPRGMFFAQGPALSRTVTLVRTGENLTQAPKMGAGLAAMPTLPTPAAIQEILSLFGDLPAQAEQEAKTLEEARERIALLEAKLANGSGIVGGPESVLAPAAAPPVEIPVPVLTLDMVQEAVKVRGLMMDAAHDFTAVAKNFERIGEEINVRLARWDSRALPDSADPSPPTILPEIPQGIKPLPDANAENENPVAPAAPAGVAKPSPVAPTTPAIPVAPPVTAPRPASSTAISAAQQTILNTLASFAAMGVAAPAKSNVAVLSGVSSKSGSYSANLSRLRDARLIQYFRDATVGLTPAGAASARPAHIPATRRELVKSWKARLTPAQGAILDLLVAQKGKSLTRAEIARAVGVSLTSGSYSANLSALKDLGLVHYPTTSAAAATALLFPKGLPE